jgi:hypothetical protein
VSLDADPPRHGRWRARAPARRPDVAPDTPCPDSHWHYSRLDAMLCARGRGWWTRGDPAAWTFEPLIPDTPPEKQP